MLVDLVEGSMQLGLQVDANGMGNSVGTRILGRFPLLHE
jgi:hypothetical protein